MVLNPDAEYVIQEEDRILVFSEERGSAHIAEPPVPEGFTNISPDMTSAEAATGTLFFGYNETLPVILRELPENVSHIYVVSRNISEDDQEDLEEAAAESRIRVEYIRKNPRSEKALHELAALAPHIVVLSDHGKNEEEADMEAIFLLLNLRDLRARYSMNFNITVEMRMEHNQSLVGHEDHTDFLVTSSMSSLILAQLAENPELLHVFRELLSNEGSELYLKNAEKCGLTGVYMVRELRRLLLKNGYIMLGYLDREKISRFNLPLDEVLDLGEEDYLIVLGEE